MSYKGDKLLSDHTRYAQSHVGGDTEQDNNLTYIKNQNKIIKNNNKKVPDSYAPPYNNMYTTRSGLFGFRFPQDPPAKSDRHDPFGDYLNSRGLLDRDNVTRYITNYINIDSSNRNKIPSATTKNSITLTNPFYINKIDQKITVNQPNHPFEVNDKITITGVETVSRILKVKVGTTNIIDFVAGSEYMVINTNHGLDLNTLTEAQAYDTSDLYVLIEGLKGFPGRSYIENIPTNTINGLQRIYVVQPETQAYASNKFYIKLLRPFEGTYDPIPYNIKITFQYIGGIPINKINAEYPIDNNHQQGYQLITETTTNTYTFLISKIPASNINGFGGSDVNIAQIVDIDKGYPNANSYSIRLDRVYENVILAKLVSSEFPNTSQLIKSLPVSEQNNKLYWQNLDDGDTVYSIALDPGNYTASNLATVIESSVFEVLRTDATLLGGIVNETKYTNNNVFKVNIDTDTNIVIIKSYKRAPLVKAFIQVNPPINLNGNDPIVPPEFFTITVQQENHGLAVGDVIIVTDAIEYFGIPPEILNGEHSITEIIDNNRYTFQIKHFNLQSTRTDSGGGTAMTIDSPNMFKLRFDYPDTMGKVLGFRNPGASTSVTEYATELSNKDPYQFELLVDEAGNTKVITNNALMLTSENYIIMECVQLNNFVNIGSKVKDIFAKILIKKKPGKILYNTFVDAPLYYFDPISQISDLDFNFYSPSGEYFNFNGLDHSFTIELICLSEIPKGTGISTLIGKIN